MRMRLRAPLLCIGLVLLASLGCGGDVPAPCEPDLSSAIIQGVVRAGGADTEWLVRASLQDASGDQAVLQTDVAPNGTYALAVPAGGYIVGVASKSNPYTLWYHSSDGLRRSGSQAEPVFVDSQHRASLDFDLATIDVRVSFPRLLDGWSARVNLYRSGPDSSQASQYSLEDQLST